MAAIMQASARNKRPGMTGRIRPAIPIATHSSKKTRANNLANQWAGLLAEPDLVSVFLYLFSIVS